jgi:serine/threonine-protein kinase
MGEVHEARDERLGRPVAIKLLRPELAAQEYLLQRFVREAHAAGALCHPHIVQVLDVSKPGEEAPFIVMERLFGAPLSDILFLEGKLEARRAARLATQILDALSAAHAIGVVHRDVKPDNIIVTKGYDGGEVVKLVDFGVAKMGRGSESNRLTVTGQVVGTPAFMAPEQLTAEIPDGRADVFAVGAVLYALLSGRPPFTGETVDEISMKVLVGDYPPLSAVADVDPHLAAIVARALHNDRAHRFASAQEMRDALVSWARGERVVLPRTSALAPAPTPPTDVPPPARRPPRMRSFVIGALVAAVLVASAAIGAFIGLRPRETPPRQAPARAAVLAPPAVAPVQPLPVGVDSDPSRAPAKSQSTSEDQKRRD